MPKHLTGSQRWWIVAVVAAVLFVILALVVASGSSLTFDRDVSNALNRTATPRWVAAFRFVTLLGTGKALGIASAIVGVALLIRRRIGLAVGWTVAQVGAVLLVKLVKAMVERDRPGLGDTDFYAHGWSFPSGHVVRTAVFIGIAAYLVFRLTRSRAAATAACVVGLAWSLIMAFSRLYLGAHFLSNVAGGLILATAWTAACLAVLEARDVHNPN